MSDRIGPNLPDPFIQGLTKAPTSEGASAVTLSGKMGALKVTAGNVTVDYRAAKAALQNNPEALKSLKEHKVEYLKTANYSTARKIMFGLRKTIFSIKSNAGDFSSTDQEKQYMMKNLNPNDVLQIMVKHFKLQKWDETPYLMLSYIRDAIKSPNAEIHANAKAALETLFSSTKNEALLSSALTLMQGLAGDDDQGLLSQMRSPHPLEKQAAANALIEKAMKEGENDTRQLLSDTFKEGHFDTVSLLSNALTRAIAQNSNLKQLTSLRDTLERTDTSQSTEHVKQQKTTLLKQLNGKIGTSQSSAGPRASAQPQTSTPVSYLTQYAIGKPSRVATQALQNTIQAHSNDPASTAMTPGEFATLCRALTNDLCARKAEAARFGSNNFWNDELANHEMAIRNFIIKLRPPNTPDFPLHFTPMHLPVKEDPAKKRFLFSQIVGKFFQNNGLASPDLSILSPQNGQRASLTQVITQMNNLQKASGLPSPFSEEQFTFLARTLFDEAQLLANVLRNRGDDLNTNPSYQNKMNAYAEFATRFNPRRYTNAQEEPRTRPSPQKEPKATPRPQQGTRAGPGPQAGPKPSPQEEPRASPRPQQGPRAGPGPQAGPKPSEGAQEKPKAGPSPQEGPKENAGAQNTPSPSRPTSGLSNKMIDLRQKIAQNQTQRHLIFDLTPPFSQADVSRSFRRLTMAVHPDKTAKESAEIRAEAEELFKILNNLKDELNSQATG